MNKDSADTARGGQRVLSGPNQGKTLFELAYDTALRATMREIQWYMGAFTCYRVTIVTGDREGAGTDADVFIVLWGEGSAKTGRVYLDKPDHDDFERGQIDTFLVGNAHMFNELTRITIGYSINEYVGESPGWFLEQVQVENVAAARHWDFPCARWLSADNQGKGTVVDLVPSTPA